MDETGTDLEARMSRVLAVYAEFDATRAGRSSYDAQRTCPVCRAGTVHFMYRGPRAVRMYCDVVDCYVRMLS